jgi:hypothetical protein
MNLGELLKGFKEHPAFFNWRTGFVLLPLMRAKDLFKKSAGKQFSVRLSCLV